MSPQKRQCVTFLTIWRFSESILINWSLGILTNLSFGHVCIYLTSLYRLIWRRMNRFSENVSVWHKKQLSSFPEVVESRKLLVRHLKAVLNQRVHEYRRFWHSEIIFKEKNWEKQKRQCVTFQVSHHKMGPSIVLYHAYLMFLVFIIWHMFMLSLCD